MIELAKHSGAPVRKGIIFVASRLTSDRERKCLEINDHVHHSRRSLGGVRRVALIVPIFAALGIVTCAQSQPSPPPDTAIQAPTAANNVPTGTISGTVLDKDGAAIPNAMITLKVGTFSAQSASGGDGTFAFKDVPAGSFEFAVSATGFANLQQTGTLQPGEERAIAPVQLVVATTVEVNVTQTRAEIAEEQIHVEETQHILGVIPNFYVSYDPEAQPLNSRQKLELGWKFTLNPVMFGIAGIAAGIQQANNSFSGYGQGAQGYAKRFGASYADFASGTVLGNIVFPVLFKQDPRYFYKGTGSRKSRFLYAVANAVICKGDNRHWQPNYSSVMGSLAAGGLSNLYYPAANRNGLALTFENSLFGIGGSAAAAVVQEFFVRKPTHAQDLQSSH